MPIQDMLTHPYKLASVFSLDGVTAKSSCLNWEFSIFTRVFYVFFLGFVVLVFSLIPVWSECLC